MTLYGPWRSSINIFVNESSWILHLDYGTYTWYITSACAMLSSVIHVSHVLMYYRKHIKSLWAGDKKYLPKKSNLRPAVSVVFAGSQLLLVFGWSNEELRSSAL
ncbi:hypothetical protein HF521_015042 [Silurus meridionalis]|uniref:Uncharacterized protein n=1 Tax=Silurus meridionalis TaxID=175797 RepID=A0A8T0A4C6_SILME|nr:hypothetical protein HF521_015042 [Silurus meridionalis]